MLQKTLREEVPEANRVRRGLAFYTLVSGLHDKRFRRQPGRNAHYGQVKTK
jgi:hypothetical protein